MKKNKYYDISPLIFLASLVIFSCSQIRKLGPSQHCSEVRAAVKVGLTKTSYILANIDSCYNKLEKILETQEIQYSFAPFLKDKYASANFKIDPRLHIFLQEKINQAKKSNTPLKIVASSIFNQNEYSQLIPKMIEQLLGQRIKVFSPKQEAREYYMAYLATLRKEQVPQGIWYVDNEKNIIVLKDGSSTLSYYSVLTPDLLKKQIISWKGSRGESPYPIGAFNAKRAIQYSSNAVLNEMSDEMKQLVRTQRINGISPAHRLISQFTKATEVPYSRFQLEEIAKEKISRSSEVEYGESDIAAFLLILGHMRSLNIQTVMPLNLETRAGILFHSSLW